MRGWALSHLLGSGLELAASGLSRGLVSCELLTAVWIALPPAYASPKLLLLLPLFLACRWRWITMPASKARWLACWPCKFPLRDAACRGMATHARRQPTPFTMRPTTLPK